MMRLERAAELLRAGVPVGEVALQTGFANSKYFSTLFKSILASHQVNIPSLRTDD